MEALRMFKDFFKGLGELLFPPVCPICEEDLGHETLCSKCYDLYINKVEPTCGKCGKITDIKSLMCNRCTGAAFDKVIYFCLYHDEIKHTIYKLKYSKERWRGNMLAFFLHKTLLDKGSQWYIDGIVPVPLYKKREINRGFNQSFLLAEKLSELSGIPVVNDAIIRIKDTTFQAYLSKEKRMDNLKDAFKSGNSSKINGRNLLLIDDIITSGTTLNYCAKVLKLAGAKRVYALTIASGE